MGSALALKYDHLEETDMAPAEAPDLAIQVAELRSDVRHVQSDIIDIKANIRDIYKQIEKLEEKFSKKFEELKDSIASAKLWALGMYITQAGGMLYIIANGAKWF